MENFQCNASFPFQRLEYHSSVGKSANLFVPKKWGQRKSGFEMCAWNTGHLNSLGNIKPGRVRIHIFGRVSERLTALGVIMQM